MRVPRISLRSSFVVLIVLAALVHLGSVTLAALPPNRYSEHATGLTSYLPPYFAQNWRLFAPNPISADRTVRMQGAYTAADGTVKTTPWVDWTAVELDLIHHRLVGGRAGYVTNKLYSPLATRYAALDDQQRELASRDDPADVASWKQLRSDMNGSGLDPDVTLYLRYDEATTRLATEVVESRWPDRQIVAVRYALHSQGVTPYDDRHLDEAARQAARPPVYRRVGGWRTPLRGDADERGTIASFDRRHR